MFNDLNKCNCGHEPQIEIDDNTGAARIVCPGCDAKTSWCDTTEQAARRWNQGDLD